MDRWIDRYMYVYICISRAEAPAGRHVGAKTAAEKGFPVTAAADIRQSVYASTTFAEWWPRSTLPV